MSDIKSLYKGDEHASIYKKHRPDMATATVNRIIDFLALKFNPSECDAVDVGCGSGQGTLPLAPFLRHIVGIDPSEAQINQVKVEGNLPNNVEFRVGEAENLPFKDSSLQLVNVKSALHWFDIPKFFQEVDRVLQPGGVLAVSCGAGFSHVVGHEKEVFKLFAKLGSEARSSEWDEKVKIVMNQYKDIKFPYEEYIRDDSFVYQHSLTVRRLMEMMKTRSDVAKFIRERPEEAAKSINEAEEKLMKIIGETGNPEETTVVRKSQQFLILCRKPQTSA